MNTLIILAMAAAFQGQASTPMEPGTNITYPDIDSTVMRNNTCTQSQSIFAIPKIKIIDGKEIRVLILHADPGCHYTRPATPEEIELIKKTIGEQ